jgi:hypothetical protein
MSNLYHGFKSASDAGKAVITADATALKGNRALVAFAFGRGELPDAKMMALRPDWASLNTLKVLGAFWPESERENELNALLDGLKGTGEKPTIGNFAKLAREAIGGEGVQPSELLTGKGETRAVKPEFSGKVKAGNTAKLASRKADALQAKREAIAVGTPADSKPAGIAEPSAEQKMAPKARFAALVTELAKLMATAEVTEPTKRERLGKTAIDALTKFDAILK